MERSAGRLLCLRCRGSGHLAGDCTTEEEWIHESRQFQWFFSEQRAKVINDLQTSAQGEVCSRCRELDIVGMLRQKVPWSSPQDMIRAEQEGSPHIRTLGLVGSITLWTNCPVCVSLFALTPSPSSVSQEIKLLVDWSWNRLCGENGTELGSDEKKRYASCLLVTLQTTASNISFYIRSHRGDALAIAEQHLSPQQTLGSRQICNGRFNIDQCQTWLRHCETMHGQDCRPEFTDELQSIRLIEIESRTIVRYPGSPCPYAALSYVWGGAAQVEYTLGSVLPSLPKTIENAIACARQLGIPYLWVDAICIQQSNATHKADQIARMWSIYRGSSLTIIALSSPSADYGLPNFTDTATLQPQLTCTVSGVTLMGLMPTLSQYIWSGAWGGRAWTLQEALLSHRCLYISAHGLYFECAVIQYSEALDESRSWAHALTAQNAPDPQHWLTWVMEQNGSGCLRNLLDTPADRFLHWGQKVTLYSYREMTDQGDGLKAFDGVLQRLQTMYEDGFFWGLPLQDFQWGLLWQAKWPPERRAGFPSWCWAGWRAGIMTPFPVDVKEPHKSPIPLKVWKTESGRMVLIFDAESQGGGGNVDSEASEAAEEVFRPSRFEDAENYALFIESFAVELVPDWSRPHENGVSPDDRCLFRIDIQDVPCLIHIMRYDLFIGISASTLEVTLKYLLLALSDWQTYVEIHLLVVQDHGLYCTRITSLSVLVAHSYFAALLQALQLRSERTILG